MLVIVLFEPEAMSDARGLLFGMFYPEAMREADRLTTFNGYGREFVLFTHPF